MGGERTSDNCYGIPNLSSDSQIICNKATIDESELWHQRLGHLNFTNMFKIASKEVVKDLPKLKDTRKGVCGPCQLGKQTRTAHKKTSGIHTSRNVELVHMDLMGPTRTASLGGKNIFWLLWMTIVGTLRFFFFGKNLMPLKPPSDCSKKFR
jgi:hypothetical protein